MNGSVFTPCAIVGCKWPVEGRGWCRRHYARWKRYRDPLGGVPPDLTLEPPANWRTDRVAYLRRKHLWRCFRLTPDDYDRMLDEQGGCCAICRGQQSPSFRHFDVDHDQGTGKVRGLLCRRCNTALGHIESKFYEPALAYLAERGASPS